MANIWGDLQHEQTEFDTAHREKCAFSKAYRRDGEAPRGGELGAMCIIPFDLAKGMAAQSDGAGGETIYPAHAPAIVTPAIWRGEPRRPRNREIEEDVTNRGEIVILGGRPKWDAPAGVSGNGPRQSGAPTCSY